MIKIAICDDELEICSMLEEYVAEACKKQKVKVDISVYADGKSLHEALCSGEEFTLIFLDIELPHIDGVEIGAYIRDELKDNAIQIAYISGKESYAMQLFKIRPINFLIKPITYEQVVNILNKTLSLMYIMSRKFVYKQKQDMHFEEFGNIMYFKSNNRKVQIVLQDNRVEEFYGKLDKICQQLPKQEFLYIHKSYIVNVSYIQHFEYEHITLVNGEVLPISQSRRKKIRIEQARLSLGGDR